MLVTRPEPGASATAARLRQAGFRPVLAPMLRVRPVRVALPAADAVVAVLVASGNAVRLPTTFRHVPLLAVGDATAERARTAGFSTVHSAGGDADDLAALAARVLAPGPVLLATGKGEGTRLAAALRRCGFRVHRRAVYAATAVRRLPAAAARAIVAGLHAALFFSAATAYSFARSLPRALRPCLRQTDAVVIGPGVAAAVQHLPWRALRVAVRPTQDGVLALL